MVLTSTPESFNNREVSLLAIIETVLAISFVSYIVVKSSSFMFMSTVAFVAPFLLLRTEYSTKEGVKIFEKFHDRAHDWADLVTKLQLPFNIGGIVLSSILLLPVVAAIPVRVMAFSKGIIRHPFRSLQYVPDNWYRATLVIDSFHPAEIVAGYHIEELECDYYQEKTFIEIFKQDNIWLVSNLFIIKITTRFLAILYRLSLKSTGVVFLPLIWIAELNYLKNAKAINAKIDQIRNSEAEKYKRAYATLIILSSLFPLYAAYKMSAFWSSISNNPLIDYFFVAGSIDSWNITRFGSAILTWFLFFYSDHIQIQRKHSLASSDKIISYVITLILRLRLIFSAWTLLIGGYVMYTNIPVEMLPDVNLLPDPVSRWISETF